MFETLCCLLLSINNSFFEATFQSYFYFGVFWVNAIRSLLGPGRILDSRLQWYQIHLDLIKLNDIIVF